MPLLNSPLLKLYPDLPKKDSNLLSKLTDLNYSKLEKINKK
jgi:hypothetical protein